MANKKAKAPPNTEAWYQEITALTHKWLKVLGLSATWDVTVEIVEPSKLPDDSTANVSNNWPYKSATIRYSSKIFSETPKHRRAYELDITAAHEVIHIFVVEHFEGAFTQVIGNNGLVRTMLDDRLEGLVDALAHVLVVEKGP